MSGPFSSPHPCRSLASCSPRQADNGWWVGINHRTQRNGIFPGTFVEEIASPN